MPSALDYAFRSYDRHRALYDFRLGDRLRAPLYLTLGERQLYFTTLLTNALAGGQALVATAYLPDLHHFRGSFGGGGVIPLYRNAEASSANVTTGLLELLAATFSSPVSAEDLAGYVYSVLAGQEYTKRFWNELETPGPRVPLTKNSDLFREAVTLGRTLLWLHTYGERFRSNEDATEIPAGTAKAIKSVSSDPAKYPESFNYDPFANEIRVGEGRFGPVSTQIWDFEVSGLKVVQSWLAYRMKDGSGKKSSPLDDIRPERWTPRMTDELLELLWVLEATVGLEAVLSATLDKIVKGQCFTATELPQPTESERQLLKENNEEGELLAIMDAEAPDEDEEKEL